jgi:hypothetical protein
MKQVLIYLAHVLFMAVVFYLLPFFMAFIEWEWSFFHSQPENHRGILCVAVCFATPMYFSKQYKMLFKS